jgi:hypothetical protein
MEIVAVSGKLARKILLDVKGLLSEVPSHVSIDTLDYQTLSHKIRAFIISDIYEYMGTVKISKSSKFHIGPGGGKGESWCHYQPKSDTFEFLTDLNSQATKEEFLSTLFHELVHLEQSARTVKTNEEKFKNLKPAAKWFDVGAWPLGIGDSVLHKTNDPYLEDPHEIEAYAVELAGLIEDRYDRSQIKELINKISTDPENLDELIYRHFDDVVIKYIRKVTGKSKQRFLKILYQCLSESLFEKTGSSENLMSWFGDSKIVDGEGKPLKLYHGSRYTFDGNSFKKGKYGYIYLTPESSYADSYTDDTPAYPRGGVFPLYVKAIKPLDLRPLSDTYIPLEKFLEFVNSRGVDTTQTNENEYQALDYLTWKSKECSRLPAWSWVKTEEFRKRVIEAGYDAIWQVEGLKYDTLAVFSPKQLKSALGNNGEYAEDENIIASTKIATGIKPPIWINELWEYVRRYTFRQITDISPNVWNAKGGYFSIPVSNFLTEKGFKNSGINFKWFSKERNPEAKQCSGHACRYSIDGAPSGYFMVVIPDAEMNNIIAGEKKLDPYIWNRDGKEIVTERKRDLTYRELDKYKTVFVHEFTHMMDESVHHKNKRLRYPTDADWEKDWEKSNFQHKKFPTEWRAHLGEIRQELIDSKAVEEWNQEYYSTVMEFLDEQSPTWNRIKKYLPAKGRRYILQAIGHDLIEALPEKDKPYRRRTLEENQRQRDEWKRREEAPYPPRFESIERVRALYAKAKQDLGERSPEAKFLEERLKTWDKDQEVESRGEYGPMHIDNFSESYLGNEWKDLDPMIKDWLKKANKSLFRTPAPSAYPGHKYVWRDESPWILGFEDPIGEPSKV